MPYVNQECFYLWAFLKVSQLDSILGLGARAFYDPFIKHYKAQRQKNVSPEHNPFQSRQVCYLHEGSCTATIPNKKMYLFFFLFCHPASPVQGDKEERKKEALNRQTAQD